MKRFVHDDAPQTIVDSAKHFAEQFEKLSNARGARRGIDRDLKGRSQDSRPGHGRDPVRP